MAIALVVVGALYLGGFGASIFRIAMLGIVIVTGIRHLHARLSPAAGGEAASGWVCPMCGRRVPGVIDLCRCGAARPARAGLDQQRAALGLSWDRTVRWQQLAGSVQSVRGRIGPAPVAALIATIGVIFGFDNQPYGYYMILRVFLCGVSLFLIAGANLVLADWQKWLLGGFAVLHNPILPIRIGEKDIWEVLNVTTVVLFWIVAFRRKRNSSPCR